MILMLIITIALLSILLIFLMRVVFVVNRENIQLLDELERLTEKNWLLEATAKEDMDTARIEMVKLQRQPENQFSEKGKKQTPRAGTASYDPDDNPPLESRFETRLRKSK